MFDLNEPDNEEVEIPRSRMFIGIQLNEPVDKYNQMWDAFRYVAVSNFE
ncbi:MAG: hypothetical protein AB2L17_12260 [Lentimicrobium sp.]|jgi:hypothetical protein